MGLTWEHPWLMPGEKTRLEPGMVFAVEAEVGRPGAGTGAFEHNVLVTEDGHEVLTESLKNVWWE
jgi:Xaa-Pro aminopeptidase